MSVILLPLLQGAGAVALAVVAFSLAFTWPSLVGPIQELWSERARLLAFSGLGLVLVLSAAVVYLTPGLLLRDGKVSELDSPNMILGIDPDQEYRQSVLQLRRGDTLLIYTDGLADAMNFQGETFGRQRIVNAFANGGATAEAISQNILWDLRRFVGLTKRTDDVTMIIARFE